jgi:hypothetical protein
MFPMAHCADDVAPSIAILNDVGECFLLLLDDERVIRHKNLTSGSQIEARMILVSTRLGVRFSLN